VTPKRLLQQNLPEADIARLLNQKRKSPGRTGAQVAGDKNWSVTRGHRCAVTAEAVIDAQGEHVHVLADPVVDYPHKARIDRGEGVVCSSHPQMVVFSTERPVGCKAILKADTHGAAPARRACRNQTEPGGRIEYVKPIAGYSRTALDVEQRRIPRPTDLAREKADAISFHAG